MYTYPYIYMFITLIMYTVYDHVWQSGSGNQGRANSNDEPVLHSDACMSGRPNPT